MKHFFKTSLVLFISIILFVSVCLSEESFNMNYVDEILPYWWDIKDCKKQGDVCYTLSLEGGLHAIDVSDPANPNIENFYEIYGFVEMEVGNNKLFILRWPNNTETVIYSFLISEGNEFTLCDSINVNSGYGKDIILKDDVLFVSCYVDSLEGMALFPIDVSDPSEMSIISVNPLPSHYGKMSLGEDYAYCINGENQLSILDISDLTSITVVSTMILNENMEDLYRHGNLLYEDGHAYITNEGDFLIVDATNIANPIVVGNHYTQWNFGRISKSGNQLCLMEEHDDIRFMDVSNPSDPFVTALFSADELLPGNSNSIHIYENNFLYCISGEYNSPKGDFSIVEVDNNYQLSLMSTIDNSNKVNELVFHNDRLYMLGEKLRIVDVADPENWEIVTTIDKKFRSLEIENSYMYCHIQKDYRLDPPDSLYVYRLSDGSYDLLHQFEIDENGNATYEMKVHDNYIICCKSTEFNSGWRLFDISNRQEPPVLIGVFDNSDYSIDCYEMTENIIVTCGENIDSNGRYYSMTLFEIERGVIREISNCIPTFPAWFNKIAIEGNLVYLGGSSAYAVADISSRMAPEFLSFINGYDHMQDIQYKNGHMFFTSWDGLDVIDASTPYDPQPYGYYHDYRYQRQLALGNDYVFLAGYANVLVLECPEVLKVDFGEKATFPTQFSISKVYPNPFNPTLNVEISLPQASDLRLTVHNVLGQEVVVIGDRSFGPGYHNFTFDGSHLSSGIYFVKAFAEGKMNEVQKVVLMK